MFAYDMYASRPAVSVHPSMDSSLSMAESQHAAVPRLDHEAWIPYLEVPSFAIVPLTQIDSTQSSVPKVCTVLWLLLHSMNMGKLSAK